MTTKPALLSLVLCLAACQSDLRPEPLADKLEPVDEARGRETLARAEAVLAGPEATPWKSLPGIEAELSDHFYGITGWAVRPWPEAPQPLTIRFRPGGSEAVVELQGEERGWIGKHGERTWRRQGSGRAVYAEDEEADFWLPTLQYFLELPFRVGEAQIVDHGGEADLDGVTCELTYVTWGSYEPNDQFDQYLLWTRKSDGRLLRADFTVRDMYDFLVVSALYSDFRETSTGFTLPHRIEIGDDPPDDLLHTIEVARYAVVELSEADTAPEE